VSGRRRLPAPLYICPGRRCGNVAAILELNLDEHLKREFTIFEAAPQVGVGFYKRG